MTHFSFFLALVCILLGLVASELDLSFIVEVATAIDDNSTECTLIDTMELKLRLASSFQSNTRKYFQKSVLLEVFEEVEVEGTNDDGRELMAKTMVTTEKERDILTQGMLRGGQSTHERQLALLIPAKWIYKGGSRCRMCPADDGDARKLSNTTSLDDYMSRYMTKDIKAYIIKKSLNGTTQSCYGDPGSAFVDFFLL